GAALAAGRELDLPVALGEDRVVAAEPGSGAGAELRPALAHDDHAGLDVLAGEDLDAEHLGVRVAAVPRGTEAFLVSHLAVLLLQRDLRLERSERALSLRVLLLVRERGLERRQLPRRSRFGDLRNGHVLVSLGEPRGGLRLGLRLRLLLGLRLRLRLPALLADRLGAVLGPA